jgi:hypothetical protein
MIHCFTNGNMAPGAVERCMRVSKTMDFSQEYHTIIYVTLEIIRYNHLVDIILKIIFVWHVNILSFIFRATFCNFQLAPKYKTHFLGVYLL